jgi:two-component system, cell cycle response regulator
MIPPNLPVEEAKSLVLVIDDSPDVHRLLKARLRQEAVDLLHAENGPAGIKLATETSPVVILLDLDMPEMDGFEVLRALKDNPKTLEVPVIILSGLQSPQEKVTAFDLGAVDYITKPFDLTELRVRVRSALRMYRLLQMLSQRAQIDGLTGLWNRAYFQTRWSEEVSRSSRHNRPLSVAMFDADHFKSINDTYGHPAGDSVLQGIGKVLQREARTSDICARYGGEEFVVIMPDTAPNDAKVFCERVRTAIEAVAWPRHPERKVTCSIGIAGAAESVLLTPEQWIELADRNLYAAKKGGRNQSVLTDVSPAALKLAKAG